MCDVILLMLKCNQLAFIMYVLAHPHNVTTGQLILPSLWGPLTVFHLWSEVIKQSEDILGWYKQAVCVPDVEKPVFFN